MRSAVRSPYDFPRSVRADGGLVLTVGLSATVAT